MSYMRPIFEHEDPERKPIELIELELLETRRALDDLGLVDHEWRQVYAPDDWAETKPVGCEFTGRRWKTEGEPSIKIVVVHYYYQPGDVEI